MLILVLPYSVKDLSFYATYYDEIIIPPEMHRVHPKSAITKRNIWMIDHADLLIAYVKKTTGGAAKSLMHAQKIGTDILLIHENTLLGPEF